MVDRIIFSSNGVRVSKPGFNANTAADVNMAMYSDMNPCIPLYSNSVTFAGNGTQIFSFSTPDASLPPTVLLRSPQGTQPSKRTFFARVKNPYNKVTIHNVDGKARTVDFKVLF